MIYKSKEIYHMHKRFMILTISLKQKKQLSILLFQLDVTAVILQILKLIKGHIQTTQIN